MDEEYYHHYNDDEEEVESQPPEDRTERKQFDHYKQLWYQSSKCNENDPNGLQQKLTLYGDLYEMTGRYHAEAVAEAEMTRLKRKDVEFAVINANPAKADGGSISAKKRDYKVHQKTRKLLREEQELRNEALRWENARSSMIEQINIMKRKQDTIMNMWNRANTFNGGS